MPRKMLTPFVYVPRTLPFVVSATTGVTAACTIRTAGTEDNMLIRYDLRSMLRIHSLHFAWVRWESPLGSPPALTGTAWGRSHADTAASLPIHVRQGSPWS